MAAAQTIAGEFCILREQRRELDTAFSTWLAGVGGLLVGPDPYFDTQRARIISFALHNRLPALYQFREHAARESVTTVVDLTEAYVSSASTPQKY